MKHLRILVCGLALQCSALPATANWLYTPGAGPSAFVSFNSGTTPAGTGLCAAANTDCLANVPIALSGQPLFTAGTPGIVTANAGTNLNTSLLALESGGNLATLAGAITAARIQANVSQINGVTPLMGNGVTGTGSQRVTIASDNTPFGVVLGAETTKVIGTVRNLGNAGAVTDFAGQNAASPANAWLTGCQFNTSPTTITSGNASPCQLDNAGNMKVNVVAGSAGGASAVDAATFTAGTSTFAPIGGQFTSGGATACVTGHQCLVGASAARELFVTDASLLAAATSPIPQCASLTACNVIGQVQLTPLPRAARNFTGCVVGTSSTNCLAANTAVLYLEIQNTSPSSNVACKPGGTAVLNDSAGSFMIIPNQPKSWGPNSAGVPTGQLNCIASNASTPIFIEWN